MIQLVKPQLKYKDSFYEAIAEFEKEEKGYSDFFNGFENKFDEFILKLENAEKGIGLEEGYVPYTYMFLVDDDKYIGTVSIRHKLNDILKKEGGHIGYDVRPSERRKGYGTMILKLSLLIAKQIGLDRVMITCDDNNVASWKIMEKNGAVLDEKYDYKGRFKRRYWIDII
ncbi:MAG: GNAT family N-acetyltransferase [Candidatus Paceibacterota bacterium]|jgi:predicted acetyltransferase